MSTVESVMTGLEAPAAAATTPAPPTPEETTAAVPPATEVPSTEQPTTESVETTEVEQEPNLEETPESSGDFAKYKPLFKDHPELRNIIGREQAYSALGNFSEVREIVQRIPTVADAEQLVADSENKRLLGQTFREDPATFVESLKESDPLAFQQFAAELPNVLAETDPAMYSAQARTYSNAVLTNLAQIAHQEGNQDLLTAIHVVAQKLGARLGAEPTAAPRGNSELERLRREKQERENADQEAAFNTFWQQTDEIVINDTVGQIEAAIKKALPTATPAQLQRMVREGYDKTLELMNQQPQTLSAINQYRENARKGRQGIADHKQIVQFITGRTKLVVPKAVKSVIDEWSGQVLKLNTETIQKKMALAAKTKDVGTGPGATTSAAAPTNAGQGKRHAKDIFAELAAGTYTPKR